MQHVQTKGEITELLAQAGVRPRKRFGQHFLIDGNLMRRLCVEGYDYELFSNHNIEIFHLAHKVDKGKNYELNRLRFQKKQQADGRHFHTNHFFEIYEHDGYSLFSDFSEENNC